MIEFNHTHLEPFLTMGRPGDWKGHDLARFSGRFSAPIPSCEFSGCKLTRESLKQAARCPEGEVSSRWLTRAILAWGGMKFAAIPNVDSHETEIAALVARIRGSNLTRKEAFDAFSALAAGARIGLGPAYFTKLIFFADPRHDGYIMDQWTAKSVNLISANPIVKLRGDWLLPANTGDTYEAFCTFIEELANVMKPTHPDACGEYVESCMFAGSTERKKKDGTGGPLPWRKYVREQKSN